MSLNPGTEFVKVNPDYDLPFYFERVHSPKFLDLPANCMIIKLNWALNLPSSQNLSEKVTVGYEKYLVDKKIVLPNGTILGSRKSIRAQLPAGITPVSNTEISLKLKETLLQLNFHSAEKEDTERIELFKLTPYYSMPPGVEIINGVIILPKPLWLELPNWTALISISDNVERYFYLLFEFSLHNFCCLLF
jgi:hypothetical protein